MNTGEVDAGEPRLLLIGPTLLAVDGPPRPIARKQVRRLATALGAHPGQTLSTDHLIDVLWDDQLPADPRAALSVVGSRLRTELKAFRDRLNADPNGWALDIATDVTEFLALTEPSDEPTKQRHRDLERATALWRGQPIAELADDPMYSSLSRLLRDRRVAATVELSTYLVANRAGDNAVELLVPLWGENPSDETLGVALAGAMAAAGHRAGALSTIDATRAALRDLGLDVSDSMTQLELEILRTSVEVIPAATTVAPAAAGRFVGRRDELDELATVHHGLTIVTGEAGAGKSALLDQACRLWEQAGHQVVRATAPEYPERPAEVVTQLVEQLVAGWPPDSDDPDQSAVLARLVPSLNSDGIRLTAVGRDALVGGIVEYLRGCGRQGDAVFVVDDLQWIDNVSSEVISQLDEVCLVASTRPTTSPAGARVADRATRTIELAPLTATEIGQLLEMAGVGGTLATHVRRITQRSGGNALFATLLIDLVVDGVEPTALPASLLLAVQHRLDALSQRALRTLCTASVFGMSAPLDGVEALAVTALADLAEAADIGLVTVVGDNVRFVHQLVHEVVVSRLSEGERVGYHEQVGLYLKSTAGNPVEIANHFDVAAPLDPLRAAEAHLNAARAAAAAFDWELVAGHALRGEEHVGESNPVLAAQLVVWIGRAQRVLHRHDVDVAQLLDAAIAARQAGHDALFAEAVVSAAICGWELGVHVDDRLREQHRDALQLDLPPSLAAELRAVACTFVTTDSHAHARELYREAVSLAIDLPDPTDQAAVLRYAKWGLGHPEDLAMLGQSARLLSSLAGDDLDLFWAGGTSRFAYGVMAADRNVVDHAVADLRERQHSNPRSTHRWDLAQIEGAFALLDNELDLAEAWLDRMFELASSQLAESWAVSIYGVMLAALRRQQGRTAELLPIIDLAIEKFDGAPGWHAGAAAAAAAAGDDDRARAELALLQQPECQLFENMTWSAATVMMADAVIAVGDRELAADLTSKLTPYADRVAWTGVCSGGLIADSLAGLASVVGDNAAASRFRTQAANVAQALRRRDSSPPLATVW